MTVNILKHVFAYLHNYLFNAYCLKINNNNTIFFYKNKTNFNCIYTPQMLVKACKTHRREREKEKQMYIYIYIYTHIQSSYLYIFENNFDLPKHDSQHFLKVKPSFTEQIILK